MVPEPIKPLSMMVAKKLRSNIFGSTIVGLSTHHHGTGYYPKTDLEFGLLFIAAQIEYLFDNIFLDIVKYNSSAIVLF